MNDYIQGLQLKFDPFAPDSAPRDFFPGGERQALLENWCAQALEQPFLAMVTGPRGSGKSTLVQRFRQGFSADVQTLQVTGTLFMGRGQFVAALAQQLTLAEPVQELPALVNCLKDLATCLELDDRALVVVVDDAHELGSDVLDAIASLHQSCQNSLSIILLAEEPPGHLLQQAFPESVLQQIRHWPLPRLDSEQARDYLCFKLASAGYKKPLPLGADTLDGIIADAGGWPGALNALAAEALMEAPVKQKSHLPALSAASYMAYLTGGKAYWSAAGVLLVILLAAVLAGSPEDEPGSGEDGRVAIAVPARVSNTAQLADSQTTTVTTETAATAPEASVAGQPAPVPAQPGAAISDAGKPIEMPEEAPQEVAQPVSQDVEQEVAPEEEQALSPQQAVAAPAVAQPDVQDEAVDPVAPRVKPDLPPFTAELLAAPGGNFTIQVMGTRSEENARLFMGREFADGQSGLLQTEFQGQPWFVVVFGNFDSRDAAETAMANLPAAIRELKPWVRPLADVHKLLAAAETR